MPEGDTVFLAAKRLHDALAGQVLTTAELRWPSLATAQLRGLTTLEVRARGKHLLHRLDNGWTLHSHLRMEGNWRVYPVAKSRAAVADRWARAVLGTAEQMAVGRKLGMLDLVRTRDESRLIGHLGPDVLAADWNPAAAAERVQGDHRPVCVVLLDQRVLAGVGTFWASELLFLHRIHPWTPAAQLQTEPMLTQLGELMRRSVQTGWQSTTGSNALGTLSYVHARSGRPCRRCGSIIRVSPSDQSSQSRTIFSCPNCQGGPGPFDDGRPQAPLGHRR